MFNTLRFGPYRCPPPDNAAIKGCGSYNTEATFEGRVLVVDCLDCGIWFEPDHERDNVVITGPTHHPEIHASGRW
jgi:hypothetical protein